MRRRNAAAAIALVLAGCSSEAPVGEPVIAAPTPSVAVSPPTTTAELPEDETPVPASDAESLAEDAVAAFDAIDSSGSILPGVRGRLVDCFAERAANSASDYDLAERIAMLEPGSLVSTDVAEFVTDCLYDGGAGEAIIEAYERHGDVAPPEVRDCIIATMELPEVRSAMADAMGRRGVDIPPEVLERLDRCISPELSGTDDAA